jgi:hypothetical protein
MEHSEEVQRNGNSTENRDVLREFDRNILYLLAQLFYPDSYDTSDSIPRFIEDTLQLPISSLDHILATKPGNVWPDNIAASPPINFRRRMQPLMTRHNRRTRCIAVVRSSAL